MKHYLVTLRLRNGEYEKYTSKLVMAENEKEAGKDALLGEMHHGLDEGARWDEQADDNDEPIYDRLWDAYDEWVYEVYEVKPVRDEDFLILKTYLG